MRAARFRSARGSSRLARGASQLESPRRRGVFPLASASTATVPRAACRRSPAGPTAPARRDLRHGRHVDGAQSRLQAHVRARSVTTYPDRDRHRAGYSGEAIIHEMDRGAGGHARDAARVESGVFRPTRRPLAGHAETFRRGPLPRQHWGRPERGHEHSSKEGDQRRSTSVTSSGSSGLKPFSPALARDSPACAGRASAHRGVGRTAERGARWATAPRTTSSRGTARGA